MNSPASVRHVFHHTKRCSCVNLFWVQCMCFWFGTVSLVDYPNVFTWSVSHLHHSIQRDKCSTESYFRLAFSLFQVVKSYHAFCPFHSEPCFWFFGVFWLWASPAVCVQIKDHSVIWSKLRTAISWLSRIKHTQSLHLCTVEYGCCGFCVCCECARTLIITAARSVIVFFDNVFTV